MNADRSSKKLLAVDVGNSDTTWAIFTGESVSANGRIRTDAWRTPEDGIIPDEWNDDAIDHAVVSSVLHGVPDALMSILNARAVSVVVYPVDIPAGLDIDVDSPEQVGSDRLASALGAWVRTGRKTGAIVIDAGTAITVDAVTASGVYAGGTISAGIRLAFTALHENTARLPRVEPPGELALPGRDTVSAMRAGVILGAACMVEGLATRIADSLAIDGPWFMTGGQGALLAGWINGPVNVVELLCLEGLRVAWEMSCP